MDSSKRILYLDVVKAVAIFLVCIGHAPALVALVRPSVVGSWINSFHMPLFMLVSGYFSIHAFQKPFGEFIRKKSLQLLVPSITIPFLTIITMFVIRFDNFLPFSRAELIGGMWFLKVLFASYLLVWVLKKIPVDDVWLCLLSCVIACVVPEGSFLQFNWMLLFFWTGYFLRKYENTYSRLRMPVTIISVIFFVFAGRHDKPLLINYENLMTMPQVMVWEFFTALTGALAVMGTVYYLCKAFDNRFFRAIGKVGFYTLGIYGLQSVVLQRIFVKYIHVDMMSFPFWLGDGVVIPLLGIASTLVCYALTLWLKRYRIANFLLFGGQYK